MTHLGTETHPVWAPGWAGVRATGLDSKSSASAGGPRAGRLEDGPALWPHFLVKPELWTLNSYLPGLSLTLLWSRNQDLRTGWPLAATRVPHG